MVWRNSPDGFGLVSRMLHWGMALLIVVMLALGNRIASMQPSLDTLWLYGLHKTLGFAVLALLLVRIAWHLWSPPPPPIGPAGWERMAARAGHWALYGLMIAIPLTGWAGSSATGIDTMAAGIVMPPLVAPSAEGEAFWFRLHGILTQALFGLVTLHMLAAFKREMAGDGTLRRMLRGR